LRHEVTLRYFKDIVIKIFFHLHMKNYFVVVKKLILDNEMQYHYQDILLKLVQK
jgi:hypothetical protein